MFSRENSVLRTGSESDVSEEEEELSAVRAQLLRAELRSSELERALQQQRELTRDLMTKSALGKPKISEKAKAGLRKARGFASSTRMLNQLKGIDNLKIEENKHKDATQRAKSVPELQFKETTPRHRARHLRRWEGPDRRSAWAQSDRCLRLTTPWLAQDEEQEIKGKDPKAFQRCKSR